MKKKTIEEFKNELYRINKDIEIVGEYLGANTHIKARCLNDNHEWNVTPSKLLLGARCPVCTNHKVVKGVNDVGTTRPDLLKYFKHINDAYSYTHGSEKIIEIVCPYCGFGDKIKIRNLSYFGYCCKNCWEAKHGKQKSYRGQWTKEHIIDYIKDNAIGYDLIDVKTIPRKGGVEKRILVSCDNDNHEPYWISLYNFQFGYRCQKCAAENPISKGESKAIKIFKTNNISYIPQYKFSDCKDKYVLPFDFYLPDYNLIIEIMGEQHEHPVELFGGNKTFEKTIYHDKIKREYLKSNNIDILDIWYYDFKNMEDIIINKINKTQKT